MVVGILIGLTVIAIIAHYTVLFFLFVTIYEENLSIIKAIYRDVTK